MKQLSSRQSSKMEDGSMPPKSPSVTSGQSHMSAGTEFSSLDETHQSAPGSEEYGSEKKKQSSGFFVNLYLYLFIYIYFNVCLSYHICEIVVPFLCVCVCVTLFFWCDFAKQINMCFVCVCVFFQKT